MEWSLVILDLLVNGKISTITVTSHSTITRYTILEVRKLPCLFILGNDSNPLHSSEYTLQILISNVIFVQWTLLIVDFGQWQNVHYNELFHFHEVHYLDCPLFRFIKKYGNHSK